MSSQCRRDLGFLDLGFLDSLDLGGIPRRRAAALQAAMVRLESTRGLEREALEGKGEEGEDGVRGGRREGRESVMGFLV